MPLALVAAVTLPATTSSATTYGGPGRIAYVEFAGDFAHIWTMNADGSDRIDLMPSLTDESADDPSWSPDGSSIAFTRGPSYSGRNIWRMDSAGGNPVQLTSDPSPEFRPSWSPDGSTIVFEAGAKIVTISAVDGSGRAMIGRGDAPTYSPNGNRIVFARYVNGQSDIFTMRADGTDVRNLTRSTVLEFLPDWSPDGKTIVFQRSSGGDHDIWSMRPDGSLQYNITHNRSFDGYPSYSPDGTRLVLFRESSGISTIDASGTRPMGLVPAVDAATYSTDWQPLQCTIVGTAGDEELFGTPGDDVICGRGGGDIIDGLAGNDVLLGEGGSDSLYGGIGADILAGGNKPDLLDAGADNDRLTGDGGHDIMRAGPGDDYLFAWDRAGGDRLACGRGSDWWAYERNDIVRC